MNNIWIAHSADCLRLRLQLLDGVASLGGRKPSNLHVVGGLPQTFAAEPGAQALDALSKQETEAECIGLPRLAATGRSDRGRIALHELPLMPIGVGERALAGGVQLGDLLRRQAPADGSQVLLQLRLVAGADDHRRDGRPLQ